MAEILLRPGRISAVIRSLGADVLQVHLWTATPHGRLEPFSPLLRNSQTGHLHDHVFKADFPIFPRVPPFSTAYRRLVGTGIAAVSEEGGGILSGDAVERRSECLFKSLDGARSDPPQIGLHLCPARFDRAKVRAVGRQVAIRKA